LARRDHSKAELARSLKRAGHAQEAIVSALERLASQRALDDARFAANYARSRLAHHGLGGRRIRAALRQRGVARDVAEAGLKEALGDQPEREVLDALARRLWERQARDEPHKRLLKTYATLVRRGFPPALVRERLNMLRKGAGDILDDYQFSGEDSLGDESEDG
jgi:regulatory protein